MAEWIECKISDIGTVVGGATPSTKKPENYENGTIAWITPKDLSTFTGRYIQCGERNITEIGLKSCSTQLLPKDTVLFSSRAPIGYVAIAANEVCTNQGFKSVVPNENTDPLFVIDLSNPQKPKIKGSVKISGFSTNLIPISSNQLLGIGYADDNTNPYTDGIKFALFDVSNPQKPTVLDSKVIHNAASEAQDNHKAILVNGKSSFVIPYEDVKSENEYTVNLKAGAIAFEVKDNKINISKKYATKILSSDIVRSTIFDNAVYTFNGGEYVNSFSLEN